MSGRQWAWWLAAVLAISVFLAVWEEEHWGCIGWWANVVDQDGVQHHGECGMYIPMRASVNYYLETGVWERPGYWRSE